MLRQLRKLFGRSNRPAERNQASTAASSRTGFKPLTSQPASPCPLEPVSPASSPTPDLGDEDVTIPLQAVLDGLTPELKRRVIPTDLGGATLTVSLSKVLSQLPLGAVKLSFGELRRAAPQLFSPGDQSDAQEVDLPLNELLVRVNPTLLPPTPVPKQAAGTDTLADAIIPAAGALGSYDEIPLFSPTPRGVPAKPSRSPIRVPLPTNSKADAPTVPPAPETPAPNSSSEASVSVPLASLTANWPALVRAEIAQLDCVRAQVILPEALVQDGLQQGRVAFPWKILRDWMNPAPPLVVSKYDDTALDLPLEVLMPLFLQRWKQAPKTQTKLVVDESIPALFAAAPTLESPGALSTEGTEEALARSTRTTETPATPHTESKNSYISPAEVVARASALDGVVGALVVLPEGLLVASNLPTQDGDALAAFLARAFGRVAQSADDAQVGGLSRLEFWADDVHWLIFNLDSVLLAAFGVAGVSLPCGELSALAEEIDRKPKN